MLNDLREKLAELARSGPGVPATEAAQVREEIEEVDRAPFLLQLAYVESLYERVEDLTS